MRLIDVVLLLSIHLVRVIRAQSVVRSMKFGAPVYTIHVSGDDIFVGGAASHVQHWKIKRQGYSIKYNTTQSVWGIASLSQTGQLFVGQHMNALIRYNLGFAPLNGTYPFPQGKINLTSLAISRDFLFAGFDDGTIRQWRLSDVQYIRIFGFHASGTWVSGLLATDNRYLYSAGMDNKLNIWLVSTRTLVSSFSAGRRGLISVAKIGDWIFGGGFDVIYQWRLSTGGLSRVITGQSGWVNALFVAGDYLFSGGGDNFIRQRLISTGQFIRQFSGHAAAINGIGLSGNFIFSGSDDGWVRQWYVPELAVSYTSTARIWPQQTVVQTASRFATVIRHFTETSFDTITQTQMATAVRRQTALKTADLIQTDYMTQMVPATALQTIISAQIVTVFVSQISILTTHCQRKEIFITGTCPMPTTITRWSTISAGEIGSDISTSPSNNIALGTNLYDKPLVLSIIIGVSGFMAAIAIAFILLIHRWNRKNLPKPEIMRSNNLLPMFSYNNGEFIVSDPFLSRNHSEKYLQASTQLLTKRNQSNYNNGGFTSFLRHHRFSVTSQSTATNSNQSVPAVEDTIVAHSADGTVEKGLYIPGSYLLNSMDIYRPIKRIYDNPNCIVTLGKIIDSDLLERSRNGQIAAKEFKNISHKIREAFYQEISIMFFFRDKPNFVQLVGFCNSPLTILTDYYKFGSLNKSFCGHDPIIPRTKVNIVAFARQISGAVREMHQAGFSHSDLKPQNVFVDRDDQTGQFHCYLGDFGLARVLDESHLKVSAYKVKNLKGMTVRYAAPEMIHHFHYRRKNLKLRLKKDDYLRADIYPLGLIIFDLVNQRMAWMKK